MIAWFSFYQNVWCIITYKCYFSAFLGSFLPVCYEHVGCFDVMPPFNNAKYVYPQPPERIQTQFFLYTGTTDSPQTLDPYDASTITGSTFSNQRPTIFIVHGYSSSVHDSWFNTMTTAILEKVQKTLRGEISIIFLNCIWISYSKVIFSLSWLVHVLLHINVF